MKITIKRTCPHCKTVHSERRTLPVPPEPVHQVTCSTCRKEYKTSFAGYVTPANAPGTATLVVGCMALLVILGVPILMFRDMRGSDTGEPVRAAKVAVVAAYYSTRDIGGGWSVGSFERKGADVVAKLTLSSDEQACSFKGDSSDHQQLAFSIACPYADDEVWNELGAGQDIVLEVSCDGRVFDRHSCRAMHRTRTIAATPANETSMIEQAAAKGDPIAESRLGVMYAEGEGPEGEEGAMPHDPAKAMALYKSAAAQGLKAAQDNLASMYQGDVGVVYEEPPKYRNEVPTDLVLAYAWSLVSGTGSSEILRGQIAPHMTAKQIKTARDLASKWKLGVVLSR